MALEPPDTITISGRDAVDVAATHADVMVTVRGSAGFGPDQALTKAKEVVALIAALHAVGIAPADVDLVSVATESSQGRLTRSSSASYQLRIRTTALEQVPLLIDAVAEQRSAGIDGIQWRYPADAGRAEALRGAIVRAQSAAEAAAAALGVSVAGVHGFTERTYDEDHQPMARMAMASAMADAAAEAAGPALDVEVAHRKRVQVQVEVTYRLQ